MNGLTGLDACWIDGLEVDPFDSGFCRWAWSLGVDCLANMESFFGPSLSYASMEHTDTGTICLRVFSAFVAFCFTWMLWGICFAIANMSTSFVGDECVPFCFYVLWVFLELIVVGKSKWW